MTTPDPFQHRRQGDEGFVSHARAVHTGVSMGWQWAQILATIVMCGFSAGVFYMKALSLEASNQRQEALISQVQAEVRAYREASNNLATEVALLKQTQITQIEKTNQNQTEIRDVRAQVDMMRSMREAYVYDAAKQQRRNREAPSIAP